MNYKNAYDEMKRLYDKLQQENQELKDEINTYENPEDLTLMFMYCDEKAKDKIKELQATNESLTSLVNSCQEEIRKYKDIIEEVREYINNNTELEHDGDEYGYTEWVNIKPQNIVFINELLQILDKVKENK